MARRRLLGWATASVALALVVLPGSVGSQPPSAARSVDASLLQPVEVPAARPAADAALADAAHAAAARIDGSAVVIDPALDGPAPVGAPPAVPLAVDPGVIAVATWRVDPEISWYGPGFYGRRTACGHAYTQTIMGVAHKTLPCGTRVTFKHGSRVVTVPVIDRGPYVPGRIFDLSAAACRALDHCFTGPIQYRIP